MAEVDEDFANAVVDDYLKREAIKKREFIETLQPGDIVFAGESKTYTFSEFEYQTKGVGYRYLNHGVHGDTAHCESNIVGETLYLNHLSATRIEREGKVVWDGRSIIEFWYRPDHEDEKDKYGFKVDKDARYRGRIDTLHVPGKECGVDEDDAEAVELASCFLVWLETPFRNGKPDDLINVNGQDMKVKFPEHEDTGQEA